MGLQPILGSCPFSGELQLQTHNYPMLIATCPQHISIFVPLMQNCLGAIDDTHVPMTTTEDRAPPYRNRKGTL